MTDLVVPTTGEILPLDDPAACLRVLSEIRDLESRLREAKAALTGALMEEFSRQGTKTMEMNGVKAELRGGSEIVWDSEYLEQALREAGMPEERLMEIIRTTVTYAVNAGEAKRAAAANPSYAEIISKAQTVIPKASYVSVKS